MARIMVYPPTSLILADLVERMGHEPLVISKEVRKKIDTPGLDSPPLNMTPEDPKRGLTYAAVDVPSGVRGRMSLIGPMIEDANAALIVEEGGCNVGCTGCARTNELAKLLLKTKGIPILSLKYPRDDIEAKRFVRSIRDFLEGLE